LGLVANNSGAAWWGRRGGGSSTLERAIAPVPPDPEVPAHHARRRFTTAYKLETLRKADTCTRHGELGALLRKEGLYSSHLITWRQQREQGLTPKKRGRKAMPVDPRLKKLEQENRRLTTRLSWQGGLRSTSTRPASRQSSIFWGG
jgi:transposase